MLSEDPASLLDLGFGTGSIVLEASFADGSSFVVVGSGGTSLATPALVVFVA